MAALVKYIDLVDGNDTTGDGLTMATAWKSFSKTCLVANTEYRFKKSPDPTSMGQNATWTAKSKTVTLSTPVTLAIDNCESGWTAGANCTISYTTGARQGTYSLTLTTNSSFTTGLMAYKALSALDCSAYQQMSFWFKNTVVTTGSIEVRLCSDSAGVTAVNSFVVPVRGDTTNWHAMTVNLGVSLGSNINSVAIYATSTYASKVIVFDNIFLAKATSAPDSLTLNSLISKNIDGDRYWYPIQSINGATIIIDSYFSDAGNGYGGTSGSAPIYKRECIRMTPAAATGSYPNQITGSQGFKTYDPPTQRQLSGGWDSDGVTQNGYTFIDGINWMGYGVYGGASESGRIENFGMVRYYNGFALNGGRLNYSFNNYAIGCSTGFYGGTSMISNMQNCHAICNSYAFTSASGGNTWTDCSVISNGVGIYVSSGAPGAIVESCLFSNSGTSSSGSIATSQATNLYIRNPTFINTTYYINLGWGSTLYVDRCSDANCTVTFGTSGGLVESIRSYRAYFTNLGGQGVLTTTKQTMGTPGSYFGIDTDVTHSSGKSWKMTFANASAGYYVNQNYPIKNKLGNIKCKANILTTLSVWVRRSGVTPATDYSRIVGGVMIRGGQVAGVETDLIATASAIQDTWEQLSLTFTPTEDAIIEFEAWGYVTVGGATSPWLHFDDITIS